MITKMKPPKEGGTRLAIVFNGSPLFTGDAGSGESNIRRWIIENDWLEAIVALPDQLFYNTGISTYIWIVTNRKEPQRRGKIQLIDATSFFMKMRKSLGNKRNEIGDGATAAQTRSRASTASSPRASTSRSSTTRTSATGGSPWSAAAAELRRHRGAAGAGPGGRPIRQPGHQQEAQGHRSG